MLCAVANAKFVFLAFSRSLCLLDGKVVVGVHDKPGEATIAPAEDVVVAIGVAVDRPDDGSYVSPAESQINN